MIWLAGFDYEAEGLTAEEAGSIASLFARFDLNDDGAHLSTCAPAWHSRGEMLAFGRLARSTTDW